MEVARRWKGQTDSNGLTAFGVFLSLEGASMIVLLRATQELRRAPNASKAIVCVAFTVWACYLAFIASHALRQTAFWRERAAQKLVLAYGVALPLLLTVLENSVVMRRGYPCVEAILVTGFNVKLQLLPLRGMLAQHFLYLYVHMACCLWRALPFPLTLQTVARLAGYIAINTIVSTITCGLMCLARNRQSMVDAPHSQQDSRQQEERPARKSLQRSGSDTYRQPFVLGQEVLSPGQEGPTECHPLAADRSSRGQHAGDSKEKASQDRPQGAQQRSHAVQRGLLEHKAAKRAERWLLEAVPEPVAEVLLVYLCSTYVSCYFLGSCVNYVQPDTIKSSPTFEMLAIMLAMFWCSSDAQQQKHVSAAQARAYKIVCGVLNGLLPEKVARHIVEEQQGLGAEGMKDNLRGLTNAHRQPKGAVTFRESLEKEAMTGKHSTPRRTTDPKTTDNTDPHNGNTNSSTSSMEHPAEARAGSKSSPSLRLRRALLKNGSAPLRPLTPIAPSPKLEIPNGPPLTPSTHMDSTTHLEHHTLYSEKHESVTVCFSDIVGFTTLSEQLRPSQVMALLGDLYAKFDALADEMGLYTLDNIGDSYMVAANLIQPIENHAQVVVDFAAHMIRIAQSTRSPLGHPLSVRVGVHTGPVMSGVLGMRRLKFTLVGDTVNLASRMESSGLKDSIQVSEETYKHLLRHRGRTSSPGNMSSTLRTLSSSPYNESSIPANVSSSPRKLLGRSLGGTLSSRLCSTHTRWACDGAGDASAGVDRATRQGDARLGVNGLASQGGTRMGGMVRSVSLPEVCMPTGSAAVEEGLDGMGGEQEGETKIPEQQQQDAGSQADQRSLHKSKSGSRRAADLIDQKRGLTRAKSLGRSISPLPSWPIPVPDSADSFAASVRAEVGLGWVHRNLEVKGKGRMHAYVLTLENKHSQPV